MTHPPSNPPPGEDDQPWQPPQQPPEQPHHHQQPPAYGGAGQTPYGGGEQPSYGGSGPGQPPYGGSGQESYGSPPGYGGHSGPSAGLASPWRRLGGIIIDYIILAIVGWLVTLPFGQVVEVSGPHGNQRVAWHAGGAFANLLVFVITLAYFTIMQGRFGQTVGKMAVGTRVVRAEDGGAISYGVALLRSFVMYVLWAICCIGGIVDSVWLLADSRRQTLHDKAARTVVVRADPNTPNPYRTR
ncbi:RDD family protein [Actinomadura gamaensis]|uniref:RDD family protein n=1 Tax=Actinomadura gamaensis TaxID=1763541 RepID=A0ABV9U5D1_9ACTN